jgi:hypothetical protein
MGHDQPATPIQTDNACANGIMNSTVKQKRSKAIDMRYYWLRDRVQQKQFRVHWQPGIDNKADYFTKHHPPQHHRDIRSTYLHPQQQHKENATTATSRSEGVLKPRQAEYAPLPPESRNPDME